MYGAASENTCAPIANSTSRMSSGKRVAMQTSSKRTVEHFSVATKARLATADRTEFLRFAAQISGKTLGSEAASLYSLYFTKSKTALPRRDR